mgnify:CR=1 FL=1
MKNVGPKEKTQSHSEQFFDDYLKDLFGEDEAIFVENVDSKSMPIAEFFSTNPISDLKKRSSINKEKSLVPTIKIPNVREAELILSQTESMIVLLSNLYLLRRSLPPKVRSFILAISEQVIDDYEVEQWTKQSPKTSVLSEA